MNKKKAMLLLSGGIDSTTLLAKLTEEGYQVFAITFNYGQKHIIEVEYAKENALKYKVEFHKIINLDSQLFCKSALVNPNIYLETYNNQKLPDGQENSYVPFRNLVFISVALSLAETFDINELYIAVNKEDSINFWDCSKHFIEKLNIMISKDSKIQIKAPFVDHGKSEILKLANKLNVNLDRTISCYNPKNGIECGVCLSCTIKKNAN